MTPLDKQELAQALTIIILNLIVAGLFCWRCRARGWGWAKSLSIPATAFLSWKLAFLFYWLFVLRARRKAVTVPVQEPTMLDLYTGAK